MKGEEIRVKYAILDDHGRPTGEWVELEGVRFDEGALDLGIAPAHNDQVLERMRSARVGPELHFEPVDRPDPTRVTSEGWDGLTILLFAVGAALLFGGILLLGFGPW